VITEDDICNQLLDHWAEQDKPHLDDEEKCCYALAVRAVNEIRRLRAEVEALRAGNARRDIELSIIETILTDGCNVDPTPIDMEYWSTTHDRLMEIMREVEALRADAERYRAMRREKGGTMSDIDKAIRLINDWNHDKEPATHGHAVWVGLKLIHEIERLRAEVDALRAAIGNLDITGGGVCAAREVVKQFDAARKGE
jgi:hypothetical protein